MSDDVKWFEFPFEQKKWKRYTKEEKERDRRRSEKGSTKFDDLLSDSLRRIKALDPEQLTPKERRQLIVAYLAAASLRSEADKNSLKDLD